MKRKYQIEYENIQETGSVDENSEIEMQLTQAFCDGYEYAIKVLMDGMPKKKNKQE